MKLQLLIVKWLFVVVYSKSNLAWFSVVYKLCPLCFADQSIHCKGSTLVQQVVCWTWISNHNPWYTVGWNYLFWLLGRQPGIMCGCGRQLCCVSIATNGLQPAGFGARTFILLHSPSLVAVGLSVGYETWPPIGWHHAFVIGWSKYRLGLPSAP